MPLTNPPADRWRLIGYVLAGSGAFLLAMKGILIKLIYAYQVDTTTLVTLRMLLSMPAYLVIGVVEWRRRPVAARPENRVIALAALVGILGFYVSSWLDFEGLHYIEAHAERLILFTYPFLVILFGRLLFNHPLRLHALASASLSYAGLLVMFGLDATPPTPTELVGVGLVLTAAATFALYQLFALEMIVRCGPALFTAIGMSAAGVAIIVHFAITHSPSALLLPSGAWIYVGALALFGTILPTFLMSAGTERIGAQGTAIISTLSPLATIALAIAILHEPFGPAEAIGTLFVIGGVGLFTLFDSRAARGRRTG